MHPSVSNPKGGKRMSKRLVALPVALIAIAALAPGMANAANIGSSTSIALISAGNAFKGGVGSPANKCKANRHVTLKRKKAGQTSFTNIGSDTTNSSGGWEINTSPVANAQYVAALSARNVGGDTCKGNLSPVTTARPSSTTIAFGASNVHGTVSSPVTACEPTRNVKLQRKTIYQASFTTIGSDNTNSNGFWRVDTPLVNGASYRGVVRARQANKTTSCMSKVSATLVA